MMTKVLIVDDESPARVRMRRLLENFVDVEIVGEASNGLEALEKTEDLKPEVIFLDIEMPELDGFGVADALKNSNVAIVFVTAYSQHALKAFEVAAADYLVKPVSGERLQLTLEKLATKPRRQRSEIDERFKQTLLGGRPRRFAIRCGAKFIVFDPATISAIMARDHYAAIITEGRELLADDSLETLSARLNPELFIRVHRSAVINVEFLKELEREGDRKYIAILKDPCKTRVPVSRERLNELKLILGLS